MGSRPVPDKIGFDRTFVGSDEPVLGEGTDPCLLRLICKLAQEISES